MEKNLDSFFFSTEGIYLTVEERSSYAHMRKGLAIPNRLFTEGVCPSEATRMLHTVKRINVLDDLCRAGHSAKLLKTCFIVN